MQKISDMSIVQVKDKQFETFISENEISERVQAVARQISRDFKGKKPLLIAVLSGSFIFAADLIRNIDIPCEISFIRVSSYSGTSSTGNIKEVIGLKEDIENRPVIIVEDIIDSGLTMKELLSSLGAKHPSEIRIATLLVKPGNLKADFHIDYSCFEIPNDFIVGYGLDYDGEGRNLRDIYTIVK